MTIPTTVHELAEFYHVTDRSIERYRAKHAPLHDPAKFREWIETQKSAPEGLLNRLEELLGGSKQEVGRDAAADWTEFEKQAKTEDPNEAMAKISKARDWAYFQFERASKARNKKDEKFYTDLLAKMEGTLHDAQIRAKKLGLDTGDLVPMAMVEKHLSWFVYYLLRCSDASIARITSGLSRAGCKLSTQQIQSVVEPVLSTVDYLEPYLRAGEGDNDAAPPDWMLAALKAGADDVLERK